MREFCTKNEECAHVSGAVCTSSGVCDCPQETVISEDRKRCLKVARDILDECVENVQCAQTFEKAVCVNQTCRCEDRYHFEPEMKRCFNNRGTFPLLLSFLSISSLFQWSNCQSFRRIRRDLRQYVRLLSRREWKRDEQDVEVWEERVRVRGELREGTRQMRERRWEKFPEEYRGNNLLAPCFYKGFIAFWSHVSKII